METNDRSSKKPTRKRKAELVAPNCRADCQIAHTIEQTAALLQCSVDTIERMIEKRILDYLQSGTGLKRKSKRIPHSAIRSLIVGQV